MRFVTFRTSEQGPSILGLVVDGSTVIDLCRALAGSITVPERLIDYIAAGPALHESVRDAVAVEGSARQRLFVHVPARRKLGPQVGRQWQRWWQQQRWWWR